MSKNINLLTNRKKTFSGNKKLVGKLRIAALTFLFIVGFSSISLFLIKARSASPVLVKEERFALSNLSLFNDKAVKYLLIQKRINDVSTILEKRNKFYEMVDLLTKNIPEKVSINSITIERKKIVMSFSSSSLSSVDLLLSNLLTLKMDNNNFKKVILNGIFLDTKSGQYLFSVDLDL